WVLRSVILTRDEYKNLSLDDLNQVMLNKVSDMIEFFIEQLDPTIPAVLAAHGTVQGAVYGSERSVMLGADLILPRSLMAHPAFAYTALGHVHKHQVLAEKPPVVYAGSLDRIDCGEEKDEKGFILVDLCGQDASWQFVLVPARPFIPIRADATS